MQFAILDEKDRDRIWAVKELTRAPNLDQQRAKYGDRLVELRGEGAAGDAVEHLAEGDATFVRVKPAKKAKAKPEGD